MSNKNFLSRCIVLKPDNKIYINVFANSLRKKKQTIKTMIWCWKSITAIKYLRRNAKILYLFRFWNKITTDGLIYFFKRKQDRPNLIQAIIWKHNPFAFMFSAIVVAMFNKIKKVASHQWVFYWCFFHTKVKENVPIMSRTIDYWLLGKMYKATKY